MISVVSVSGRALKSAKGINKLPLEYALRRHIVLRLMLRAEPKPANDGCKKTQAELAEIWIDLRRLALDRPCL